MQLVSSHHRRPLPCFCLPLPPPPPPPPQYPPGDARDAAFIRRCVELARRALGQTRPNPPVGCVLTDPAGRILGEGLHLQAGGPHAEVHALRAAEQAGHSVGGATAYVSLEPCNHYGRTPPCAATLAAKRVGRVVVGMLDPDPRTSGGGVATLRAAGVDVSLAAAPERMACASVADGFVSRVLRKRPLGLLKYAMTLDGKIASETGSSRWVTGADARARVHAMRAEADAIVVGGQTVRKDDPQLTVRGVTRLGDLSPIRVVMTKSMDLPYEAQLWDTEAAETVVFTAHVAGREDLVKHLRSRGVVVVHEPMLTPDHVMQYLYDRDCLTVMWECGGALAAQAVQAGAVQRVHAFVAPKIIGGRTSPTPIASPPVSLEMGSALQLKHRTVETFDNGDILISGYLQDIDDWHDKIVS